MPKKTTTPKTKKATTVKKATLAKKSVDKKTVAKKVEEKKASKPAISKKEAPAKKVEATTPVKKAKSISTRKTPAASIGFSLSDVRKIAKDNSTKAKPTQEEAAAAATEPAVVKDPIKEIPVMEAQSYGAASLADILGFDPNANEKPANEEEKVSKQLLPYYKLLVELREHVNEGLNLHSEETLKRSSKDESGDLSSYSQHMADTGTDTFDRDFALSLVSNEQEALHEIEEAIKRILDGTYGICELTGKAIRKERLRAVPFARYSVESQSEMEKSMPKTVQTGGAFADATAEDGARVVASSDDE
ncbi:MAG: TraR/DksA C4-type zinc finger protein [Opitutaceae bacterium]|nr:TraR/DksA C4-type zinc finger protein [Opitutaceae bacterium]